MRARIYYALLGAILVCLLMTYSWPPFPVQASSVVLLLAGLAVLAESLAFELSVGGTVSLTFAICIAGLLYAGPLPAALIAAVGAVPPQDFRDHKPPVLMVFNVVMLALSALTAGVVFAELGGVPLVFAPRSTSLNPSTLVPILTAALVLHLLNMVLFSVAFSLSYDIPLLRVWKEQNLTAYVASFAVLALLGLGMAQLINVAGWTGAALMVVPFAVARQTFQVYKQLTDAYTETIRSFVTAIEAKDAYTRGHSERVAQYARTIAASAGVKGRAAERIEHAALLHDVGKIGVRRDILTKPGKLTSEEFAEIRLHPDVGCRILGSVDFLQDIVPIVRAHHERVDGAGYPDGLQSSDIPFEARLLAVADAYDAMTSDRPYRTALSGEEAMVELQAVAGSQLDRHLVSAFLGVPAADERADQR